MRHFWIVTACFFLYGCSAPPEAPDRADEGSVIPVTWRHVSSTEDALVPPNRGDQQTASAVFDVDGDGVRDFLIAERTQAPSVVWYQREDDGWSRAVVELEALPIEAGSAVYDIDGDGDQDVVFGGDASSNAVWWWENPSPDLDSAEGWVRRPIKREGSQKHHDQLFVDWDGDGQKELFFWNQGAQTLFMGEIPEDPRSASSWPLRSIYEYEADSEPPQRGTYPEWKGVHEHEGLAAADVNQDGRMDVLGGGRWFEYLPGEEPRVHVIDEGYTFSRIVAGQFIIGGRPEVVMVAGDGRAPLIVYEWQDGRWLAQVLVNEVQDGHTLSHVDFDQDGRLDVFVAEMRLGNNPDAKTWVFLGDGEGRFRKQELLSGFGLHESYMGDLDGDGDLDILGKPYTWEAPRLDIWLHE